MPPSLLCVCGVRQPALAPCPFPPKTLPPTPLLLITPRPSPGGVTQDWGFSPEFTFRAAPPPGSGQSGQSVKFLVVADMGQAEADGSLEQAYYTASLNTTRCAPTHLPHPPTPSPHSCLC